MGKVELKDRLREAMEMNGMKQADLVSVGHFDKGQLSAWLSGKYRPKQVNIDKLSRILGVSEAWLMGYDVPKDRMPSADAERFNAFAANFNEHRNNKIISLNLSDEELDLINKYRSLNASEKDIVMTVLDKVHAGHKDESDDTILTLTVEDLRQMPLPLRMKFESYVDGDKLNLVARKRKK